MTLRFAKMIPNNKISYKLFVAGLTYYNHPLFNEQSNYNS